MQAGSADIVEMPVIVQIELSVTQHFPCSGAVLLRRQSRRRWYVAATLPLLRFSVSDSNHGVCF